jgi:adenosine kinase
MATLICGSLAFDTIMGFEGRFAAQILPEQLHILNVSFLVPRLRRDWGGCAGNIAYAMLQLGGRPLPVATLGSDGAGYLERLRTLDIRTDFIKVLPDAYTAQAMIMTDQDNNQITAFHPGAMARAHENVLPLPLPRDDVRLAIVSPDGREAMCQRAEQFAHAGIPFVFDPGQGLPMFDGAELAHLVELATWVTVNDYEGRMLCDRMGLALADISRCVQGLVVTLGGQGCDVWEAGAKTHVPPIVPTAVVDPTGCGDAWRGALLYGLELGWSLQRCAALGNRIGALKVATRGPQNYEVILKNLPK